LNNSGCIDSIFEAGNIIHNGGGDVGLVLVIDGKILSLMVVELDGLEVIIIVFQSQSEAKPNAPKGAWGFGFGLWGPKTKPLETCGISIELLRR
jgi:hypothetical protein